MSLAIVDSLREKIRQLEAQPRQWVMSLRTGWDELDAFGAFRLGTGVELCGEEASGRTTIALQVVASACRERRLSAWVDGPRELYPPSAMSMGVELERLLIARPKTPNQLVWTAMQLLRSGAFTCVVLDVTHTPVRLTMVDTKKLLDAARTGGSLLVLLTAPAAPGQGFARLVLKTAPAERAGARFHCEPHFELEAPHGRRAVVRSRPVGGRRLHAPLPPPQPLPIIGTVSHQRPVKRNVLRDGYANWWGGHPRESHRPVPAVLHPPERGPPRAPFRRG